MIIKSSDGDVAREPFVIGNTCKCIVLIKTGDDDAGKTGSCWPIQCNDHDDVTKTWRNVTEFRWHHQVEFLTDDEAMKAKLEG